MQRYIIARIWQSLIALLLLSMLIFLLVRATGNPALLFMPIDATPEDVERVERHLGLDEPVHIQYWHFLSDAVRGNFGQSILTRRPVMELIGERLPNSVKLAAAAIGFCVLIAIPLGIAAAVRRGRWMDTVAKLIAVSGQAAPPFWLGIVLIEIFAIRLEILPVAGMRGFTAYILPAFTMGWFITAGIMRLLRSSMIDVLDSDFMTMARAKGVSEKRAIFKHALRNSLIPVVSLGGIYFATLITMAVIVETVFAWPGLGRLAYEAIRQRDFPVIQGVVLMAAVIVITVNMFIDMLYAFLDPRIRYR